MSWPQTPEELIEAQLELAIARQEAWRPPSTSLAIGACVVLFPRGQSGPGARGDPGWAAACVMHGRRVLAEATVFCRAGAPYVAGLLALREGPCLETAAGRLPVRPDVLLIDATGGDHPRRAGMAIHLGMELGLPTVGVTHRPLLATGEWPDDRAGASSPLILADEHVGSWVRTRTGARPLAVHAGWRTDVDAAVEVVLRASAGHRTPEPFRYARRLAREARSLSRAPSPTRPPQSPRRD